jgi:hypothetical protein
MADVAFSRTWWSLLHQQTMVGAARINTCGRNSRLNTAAG